MKLDETLLSAYLDGELDEAARVRVEQALLESPQLAERLREMAAVRSMLGQLPRAVSDTDLSSSIEAMAARHGMTRWRRLRGRAPVVRYAGSIGAVAASAAAVLLLVWMTRVPAENGPIPSKRALQGIVAGQPSSLPAKPSQPANLLATGPPAAGAVPGEEPRAPGNDLAAAKLKSPAVSTPGDDEGSRLLAAMLREENVTRTVIVLDELRPDLLAVVEGAILKTTRVDPRFAEVRLGGQLELDPAWPNEAVVYAVRMRPAEFDRFTEKVQAKLPDCVVEPEPAAAAMLAQLARVPAQRMLTGDAVSLLVFDPPGDVVEKLMRPFTRGPARELDGPDLIHGWPVVGQPVGDEEEVAAAEGTTDGSHTPVPRESSPVAPPPAPVYLVWVTTRPTG